MTTKCSARMRRGVGALQRHRAAGAEADAARGPPQPRRRIGQPGAAARGSVRAGSSGSDVGTAAVDAAAEEEGLSELAARVRPLKNEGAYAVLAAAQALERQVQAQSNKAPWHRGLASQATLPGASRSSSSSSCWRRGATSSTWRSASRPIRRLRT
eukprot:scaffold3440_cov316-Prasinococcus_capsulatus_cf.AAC.4